MFLGFSLWFSSISSSVTMQRRAAGVFPGPGLAAPEVTSYLFSGRELGPMAPPVCECEEEICCSPELKSEVTGAWSASQTALAYLTLVADLLIRDRFTDNSMILNNLMITSFN